MTKLRNYLDTVSIYIGTYKKYNEGSLYGKWLNLSDYSDYESLQQAMRELHEDEKDPEFMIQDYECPTFIETLGLISECYLSKGIYNIADLLTNLNYDYAVLDSFFDCFGEMDLNEVVNKVNECYYGRFNSDIEFVRYILYQNHF